jgi:hypothetical protein
MNQMRAERKVCISELGLEQRLPPLRLIDGAKRR